MQLKKLYSRKGRVGGRAKKWWDEEVREQARKVRKARRVGHGAGGRARDAERYEDWKEEVANPRKTIKKKKQECWRNFTEEMSDQDPWKLIAFARDPWRSKGRMKDLEDEEGNKWEKDKDKVRCLVDRNFGVKERGAEEEEGETIQEEEAREGMEEEEELRARLQDALRKTSSKSASGPDGILRPYMSPLYRINWRARAHVNF